MRGITGVVAAFASAALLVGCAAGRPDSGAPADVDPPVRVAEVQFEHDGLERSFRVTAPADEGGGDLPVVVALHGAGGSAVTLSYLTGFDQEVAQGGFLLVEPNGSGPDSGTRTWNAGTCCGTSVGTVDDIGYLAAILDRVAAEFPVDTDRVFLAGFSNGGMLAYRAACELGDRLAGIAVVAGTMNVEDCPAPAPVPVLAVHGDRDTVVPIQGGESSYGDPRVKPWYNLPVEEAIAFWAARNGCPADPSERRAGAARVIEWTGCSVELWIVEDGRHTWFGGPMSASGGLEPRGAPSATDLVLDFFGLTAAGDRAGAERRLETLRPS